MRIMNPAELSETLRADVKIDTRPLQKPGRHLLEEHVELNERHEQDVRMFWTVAELEGLLEIAKASRCGRVEFVQTGLIVDRYRAPSGHVYTVWQLSAGGVRPESPEILKQLFGDVVK